MEACRTCRRLFPALGSRTLIDASWGRVELFAAYPWIDLRELVRVTAGEDAETVAIGEHWAVRACGSVPA